MKSQINIFVYSMLAFFLVDSPQVSAQQWEWTTGGFGANHKTEFMTTDIYNNSYFAVYYSDSLSVGGITYFHPSSSPSHYDCLLLKYDHNGILLSQLDIFTEPDATLYPLDMVSDSAGDLFIAGSFMKNLTIGDTTINRLPFVYDVGQQAYLAKLNNSLDLEWAKVIGCQYFMYYFDLKIRNNKLYYLVNTASSSGHPATMYCFGQDTLIYTDDKTENLLFLLDLEGKIQSFKEIIGYDYWPVSMVVAKNEDLYIIGWTNNDTVFFDGIPYNIPSFTSTYLYQNLILGLNNEDSLVEVSVVPTNLPEALNIDAADNQRGLYFDCFVTAPLIFGSDTIACPYSNQRVIGKLDAQRQLSWYQTLVGIDQPTTFPEINLRLLSDTLFVAFPFSYYIYFSDTVIYHKNGIYDNLIASYNANGERIMLLETNTTSDSKLSGFGFDNCNNILIAGNFQGKAIYGNDTIVSHFNSGPNSDLLIAYLNISNKTLDLGPDATVCDSILLKGPLGWDYYNWNNGLSDKKELMVAKSGKYTLTVSDLNCCQLTDSLNVTVLPSPTIYLGNDTLLKQSHTFELTVPQGFTKYFWSTGDTLNSVNIKGSYLVSGDNLVWCKVYNENCSTVDSLMITIIDDKGIPEFSEFQINIFPNPFSGSFSVSAEKPVESIEILDLSGKSLACYNLEQKTIQPITISLLDNRNRILILKMLAGGSNHYRKLIQIGDRNY